eukprot:snap_masked-scaffold_7-processed-gene-2.40-mRNA-1 protein AED:1.00 eAED:1.00 QI:0/0/0/0/1/1/2/0/70
MQLLKYQDMNTHVRRGKTESKTNRNLFVDTKVGDLAKFKFKIKHNLRNYLNNVIKTMILKIKQVTYRWVR